NHVQPSSCARLVDVQLCGCTSTRSTKGTEMTDDVLVEDRIEREIAINAPVERVWQLVSEPGWWINSGQITEHRIERDGDLAVVHDEAHGEWRIRTVRTDPPRYVSFRWDLDASGESAGLLVEFFIDERPGGV